MTLDYSKKLIELYRKESKHSSYQILAKSICDVISESEINVSGMHEQSRFRAILSHVSLDGLRILDIGGNTGYFAFTAIENGAEFVDFFEGNASHAEFVSTAAFALNLNDRIKVHNEYFEFSSDTRRRRYDLCFCLNVTHHLGDDFGKSVESIGPAKDKMVTCINSLSDKADFLVFQMGFNWKGDIRCPLFPHGTKREMIDYISSGTRGFWDIVSVQIAEESMGQINYTPANEKNLARVDTLGEFLNRPLFFMTSQNRSAA